MSEPMAHTPDTTLDAGDRDDVLAALQVPWEAVFAAAQEQTAASLERAAVPYEKVIVERRSPLLAPMRGLALASGWIFLVPYLLRHSLPGVEGIDQESVIGALLAHQLVAMGAVLSLVQALFLAIVPLVLSLAVVKTMMGGTSPGRVRRIMQRRDVELHVPAPAEFTARAEGRHDGVDAVVVRRAPVVAQDGTLRMESVDILRVPLDSLSAGDAVEEFDAVLTALDAVAAQVNGEYDDLLRKHGLDETQRMGTFGALRARAQAAQDAAITNAGLLSALNRHAAERQALVREVDAPPRPTAPTIVITSETAA